MKYLMFLLCLMLSNTGFAWGDKVYNKAYDPFRNPFVDFESGKQDAATAGKLVLLEFGGDWCIWCMRLDKFFDTNVGVRAQLDDVFIVVKINISEEKPNLDFTKKFPKIPGYPHFIITNSHGEVLGAQDTGKLEKDEGYSRASMVEFIARWKAYSPN